jgi:hypothetical protein
VRMNKIRTRSEIESDEDIETTQSMMETILMELQVCKARVDDIINDSGWDACYFDVEIDLKVKFDKTQVKVREAWKAMEI